MVKQTGGAPCPARAASRSTRAESLPPERKTPTGSSLISRLRTASANASRTWRQAVSRSAAASTAGKLQ
jgi:hypothetical protein